MKQPLTHALFCISGTLLAMFLMTIDAFLVVAPISFALFIWSGYSSWRFMSPPGGIPNLITLTRLIVLVVSGFVSPFVPPYVFGLMIIGIMLLDGLDGYAARKLDQRTEFGALFDLEVDACLALILCLYLTLHAGFHPLVLMGGLLRYVFVAWKYLSGQSAVIVSVPGAKVIAVVFFSCLLTPMFFPLALAQWLVWTGVGLVCYSFGMETLLILRKKTAAGE